MSKKLRLLFKSKREWASMRWLELAHHYNYIVAKGMEELGKLDVNDLAYLIELRKYIEEHKDRPLDYIFEGTEGGRIN